MNQTLADLAGAQNFSMLDANSGFWQILLACESHTLSSFLTYFGHYCFNKLLFGISNAPELFQKRMVKILEGLEGVLCYLDDVLMFGKNSDEHKIRLQAVLECLEAVGVTLNSSKCAFNKDLMNFLGHIVDKQGIRADPEKTMPVSTMKPPHIISERRRFLEMANQVGK